MTLSPNQQLRALNQVQNICDIQVQAQLCLTIAMSLCRYNEKTAVSSSICKNAHWYNSFSADSTLYDASFYSNYYVPWCIIRVSLGLTSVLVARVSTVIHCSRGYCHLWHICWRLHICLAVVSSESNWALHQLSMADHISLAVVSSDNNWALHQMSLWQTTSAWQWSHQRATEHYISCVWQITSAWQWAHQRATEHFISGLCRSHQPGSGLIR